MTHHNKRIAEIVCPGLKLDMATADKCVCALMETVQGEERKDVVNAEPIVM